MSTLRTCAAICALTACLVACSDKEQKKRTYFEKGNAAFAQQQYAAAALEYRNAIKIDPLFGDARLKLAQTYERSGELGNALGEYVRAADLLPGNVDAQLTAAKYLLAARQFDDARARAKRAVDQAPRNAEAHLVLANSIAGQRDLDGAMKEIEEAISLSPDKSAGYTNKAGLLLAQGRNADALANYEKAVEIEPRSVTARLALANYHLSVGAVKEAEAAVTEALKIEPSNALANRSMALLYVSTGRALEAEPYVKATVAAIGTADAELSLADYYVRTSRPQLARPILDRLASSEKSSAAANVRLAQIEFAGGDHAAALKRVDAVLDRNPGNPDALAAKAGYLLKDGRAKDALPPAEAAVKANPRSAPAHFLLGTVRTKLGDTIAAKASFSEVLKLNPRAAAAQTALSALSLSAGSTESSVQLARDAIANQPNSVAPRLLLVRGLLARGEVDRAGAELAALQSKLPEDPTVRALNGTRLLIKKDIEGARREYERALARDPRNIDALTGLASVDGRSGQLVRSRERVAVQLAQHPADPGLLLLAARIDLQDGQLAAGEAKLRQVVDLAPASLQAYQLLGGLYVRQKKLDEARREFEAVAAHEEKPVGAHTIIGMILQLQNKPDAAMKAYEQALTLDPTTPVAANNLAYLYAERGENLDQALALARAAADRLPDEPTVSDTIGWVYYKKQIPTLAVPEFEKSVQKAPANPTFHYHLGLAYARSGETEKARRALEEALRLNPAFADASAARQALASLKG